MNTHFSFHLVSAAAAMILSIGRLVELTSSVPEQTLASVEAAVTDATPVKSEVVRSTHTHRASHGLPVNA